MTDTDTPDRLPEEEMMVRACLAEPSALLPYADWLEERTVYRHAALVRLVSDARFHAEPGGRGSVLLLPNRAVIGRVVWWSRHELWFWMAASAKGTADTKGGARERLLRHFLCHRWPASACPCSRLNEIELK